MTRNSSGTGSAPFQPQIVPYSSCYVLLRNARVFMWEQDEAVVDNSLFSFISGPEESSIVAKIGGLTYYLRPEASVPAGAVAVPKDNHDDPQSVLLQK